MPILVNIDGEISHMGTEISRGGGNLRHPLAAGRDAFGRGQFADAVAIWSESEEVLKLPADHLLWIDFAVALRRTQDLKRFETLRTSLQRRGRPHIMVDIQYALLLNELSDADEAISILEKASETSSSVAAVDLLRVQASIFAENGRFDEALNCAEALEALDTPKAAEAARFCLAFIDRKRYNADLRDAPNEKRLLAYWRERQNAVYIHVIKQIISVVAKSANVVADIGSNATPILDYFPENCSKYSVDPGSPYVSEGVHSVREDFHSWKPPQPIQIASCFQVMEHVPDPEAFARRLLELSEVCIVSVPYREAPGLNPGHIHSMIDESTVQGWFGRKPNYQYVARELDGGERIINVFDVTDLKNWPTLCAHCENGLKFRYRWSKRNFGKGWLDV